MILDGYTNNKLRFKSVFKVFFSSPTTTIISEAAVCGGVLATKNSISKKRLNFIKILVCPEERIQ